MDDPLYVSRLIAPLLGYSMSPLDRSWSRMSPEVICFWQTAHTQLTVNREFK